MEEDKKRILFDEYQRLLDWVDRRMDPKALAFYKETPESWRHVKEAVFMMYQNTRRLVGDVPSLHDLMTFEGKEKHPPHVIDGTEFPCLGILRYRDMEFPVYNDDYGMSAFIVLDGRVVQVDSFGGETDWYYVLDGFIDRIWRVPAEKAD